MKTSGSECEKMLKFFGNILRMTIEKLFSELGYVLVHRYCMYGTAIQFMLRDINKYLHDYTTLFIIKGSSFGKFVSSLTHFT